MAEVAAGALAGGMVYLLAKDAHGKTIQIPVSLYDALTKDLRNQGQLPSGGRPDVIDIYHVEDSMITKNPANSWTPIKVSTIGGAPVWHGRDLSSNVVGDWMEINYTGADLWLRIRMNANLGKADIYVDDIVKPVTTFDCNPTDGVDQMQMIPFGLNLERGPHKLRIQVNTGKIEINGIVVKQYRGGHQVFAYPESTLSTLSNAAAVARILLEADAQQATGSAVAVAAGTALSSGVNLVSANISNASVLDIQAVVIVSTDFTSIATTWTFTRDGVSLGTFTTPGGRAIVKFVFLDVQAPAGTRTYAVKPSNSTGFAAAAIFLMNSGAVSANGQSAGTSSQSFTTVNAVLLNITVNITPNSVGNIVVSVYFYGGSGTTLTLKRGTTTLTTFVPGAGFSIFSYTDPNVPAGAQAYALTSSGTGFFAAFMTCISNGGALGTAATLQQIDIEQVLAAPLSATNPVFTDPNDRVGRLLGIVASVTAAIDVSDRAGRLLGVVYGSQSNQLLQRATTFDLQTQLRTAGTEYDARQIRALTSADVVDVSDRAARLLGVVYGSQANQLLQRAVSFDLQTQLRTAGTEYDARQIRTLTSADVVDVSDRAARLLGVAYGSLDKLQQRAVSLELLVQLTSAGVQINPQTIRALTNADVVTAELSKWIGSAAPTVGSKTSANSLPVVIASDQGTFPVTVTFPATSDVSDRAARLLGVVYGSQAQQLLQRAISFDLQTQLRTAGVEYDARQIRTLASTDVVDVFDRAGRLVGITYGNLGQVDQRLVGARNLKTVDLEGYLGTALGPSNPVDVQPGTGALFDVKDRAGRLVGIVYGSVGQVIQKATTGEALVVGPVTGTTQSLGRLQPWYQPNAIRVLKSYDALGIAPHVATTRWTYTVPASRIAIVRSVQVFLLRVTAPGAAGLAESRIDDGAGNPYFRVFDFNAAISVPDSANAIGEGPILFAGDVLRARTSDASTLGTYDYEINACLIEFDI